MAPASLSDDDWHLREECISLSQQEVYSIWINGDDSVDLHPGVLAAQEISHGASMRAAAKSRHIQVLGEKLNIEESVRTEGFPDALVGQPVGRVILVLAVKHQNPLLG